MMERIKEVIRAPLVRKRDYAYYRELNRQFISYDQWVRNIERNSYEPDNITVMGGAHIRIVEYRECGPTFCLSDFSEEILIFAADKDLVAKETVSLVAKSFATRDDCLLLYGDEDEWNSNRTLRMNPWLKPEFSPDTLLSYLYYGNLFAVRVAAFVDLVWRGSQDYMENVYDFALKASLGKRREQILHVNRVLYHSHNLKPVCAGAEYDSVRSEAQSRLKSQMEKKTGLVSVIIPSKDHPETLETCISSVVNRTEGIAYEIIVVDNGSSPKNREIIEELKNKFGFNYIYSPSKFNFSAMCNLGAEHANGDFLLFLNDDIEVRQKKWLAAMTHKASLAHVGAVGAKLYYPDSKVIQHDGITNLRLGPVHKLQFKEDRCNYYYGRNVMTQNVLAVTGACLMVRKEVFVATGGFDEELAVAFNDVEFCFRLYENGLYNVICNDIHLWHYESLSRGNDEDREKQERLQKERSLLYQKHPMLYAKDPFYHPYLNNDILDTNYSYAYQYSYSDVLTGAIPQISNVKWKPEWENECLMISIEYAGDLNAWEQIASKPGAMIYLQGYAFVAGTDNACYQKEILLQNTKTMEIYTIFANTIYRPDLEQNLKEEEHAALCGFALSFSKEELPKGEYRIGVFAKSTCSRQKLYRFTGKYLMI